MLTLLALLPVLVVALVNARQNRRDADRDVRRSAESSARLAAAGMEQRLEAARQLLASLSNESEIVGLRAPACRRRLARELRVVGIYLNFAVVGPDGRLVCTAAPPGRPGSSLARATWFGDVIRTGRPAVGDDRTRQLAGGPALVVASPLRRRGGAPGGAIAALLDLDQIKPIVSSIDLPTGGTLTAFEADGRILARFPGAARYVGRRFPDAGLVRAGRAQRAGTREAKGLDDVTRVYAITRVTVGGPREVVVAVGLSKHRAQAAPDRTLRRTLITLLVVALAAIVLVLVIANSLVVRPLRAIAAASRRIASGDYHARSGVAGRGEVGELAAAFDDMAATLEARQRQIDRSTGERQRLLAELISAEEEERKRIAGDIHDDSIQALGALLLRLEIIESRMEEGEARTGLAEAREAARDSVSRLRHLVFKLSPPALDRGGLVPALEIFLDEVSRVWGPAGRVRSDLDIEPSSELRALVYRIASEAVNNAAKHARAEHISISIEGRNGGVWVQVADDGVGFDVDSASHSEPGHIGLVSMRERAESAGGWWRVTSEPGQGSSVEFWMPDRADEPV
jgi:signal transduction histidine kinase